MDRRDLALLLESADDLGDTFARNRLLKQRQNEFDLTRQDRKDETALERAMREKEFGLKRDDAADARDIRRQGLAQTAEHQAKMQDYQRLLLEANKEQNEQRRTEQFFKIMGDMNKDGMLTDDGIERMSDAFNERFAPAGLQVKIFKAPTATAHTPQEYRHPRTGKEFLTFGNTMMPAGEVPTAEITEEEDPLGGPPKRKTTRKVPVTELDKAMQQRGVDETGGPSPQQQREIDEIMATPPMTPPPLPGTPTVKQPPSPLPADDRVSVISPTGKRGKIPRGQLPEALKQGYKLVP